MTPTGHPTPRPELEAEFGRLQAALAASAEPGGLDGWLDRYTDDVVYVEHVHGVLRGRAELRAWAAGAGSGFPGRLFTTFPVEWSVVDPEYGRVVWRAANRMCDPGDGSVHEFGSLSVAHDAGDGRWSHQEDAYAQRDVDEALTGWFARFHALHAGPAPAASVTGRSDPR